MTGPDDTDAPVWDPDDGGLRVTSEKQRTRIRGGRTPYPDAPARSFRDNTDVDAVLARIDATLAAWDAHREAAT